MTFVTNPYIFLLSSNVSKEQKGVRLLVNGEPEAGAVIRVRLGSQVFSITVPANSTLSTIASALAFAINSNPRYDAIAEGDTVIVTGPPYYDYPVEILTTSIVVPAKVALTGFPRQIASNFQTDISKGVATLVIDGVTYESKAVAGDTITTAASRLADMIRAGLVDFKEEPSLSGMRQIPGRDPFAFERYIRTSDGTSITRILRTTDNGQHWAGKDVTEEFIPVWQAEFGGKKIAIYSGAEQLPNQVFTQQGEGAISATNRNLRLPQSPRGYFIYTRGHYFSEGVFYMVGREQDPALGITPEIHLYSTTDGLNLIDLGKMERDPTDTYGKDSNRGGMGAYSYDLMHGSTNIGDSLSAMTRNNGRWFLRSAHAVYWTDAIVPVTGWRRANMTVTTDAFNEGLGPMFAHGNTLLVPLYNIPGPAQYAVSYDNGTSWATEAIIYIEPNSGQGKSDINFFAFVNGSIIAYHAGTGVMPTNEVFVSPPQQPLAWSSRPLRGIANVSDVLPLTYTGYGVAFIDTRYDETAIMISTDGYEFKKADISRFIEGNGPQQLNAYVDFENVIVEGINSTPQATGSSTGSATYVTYVNEADWVPVIERQDPARTFFPAFARPEGRVLGVYYGPNPLASRKLYASYDRGRNFSQVAGTPAKITQASSHRAIRDDDTYISLQLEDLINVKPKDVNVVRGVFGSQPVAASKVFSHLKSPVAVATNGAAFFVIAEPRNIHRSLDGLVWEDLGTMDLPNDFSHQVASTATGPVYSSNWAGNRLQFIRNRWFFSHDKLYYTDDLTARTGWKASTHNRPRSAPGAGLIMDLNGVLYQAWIDWPNPGDDLMTQGLIFRSFDLGARWEPTVSQPTAAKASLTLLDNVLVGLATDKDRASERSFDGGDTWLLGTTNISVLAPGQNESSGGTMYVRAERSKFSETETNDILYSEDGVNFGLSKAPNLGTPGAVVEVAYGPTGVETKTTANSAHTVGDTVAIMFNSGNSATITFYRVTPTALTGYGGVGAAGADSRRAVSEGQITYALFAAGNGVSRLLRIDRTADPRAATHTVESPTNQPWADLAISTNALWVTNRTGTELTKLDKATLATTGSIVVDARAVASDGPFVYVLTGTQLICYSEEGALQFAFDVPYGNAPDRRVTIDAGRAFIEGDNVLVYRLGDRQLIATLSGGRVSIGGDEVVVGVKVYDRASLAQISALAGTRPINVVVALGGDRLFVGLPAWGGDAVAAAQIWQQLA